jgi:toxin ParE1/3/4
MALFLAPKVAAELDEIWYYVARESGNPQIADRLIDSITARFFLLSTHPFLGRPRDKELRPGLRSFPVGNYLVIYKVKGEDVLVLHVAHGNRDLASLFES